MKGVVALEAEATALKHVAADLERSYAPSADSTDWAGVLQQRIEEYLQAHP